MNKAHKIVMLPTKDKEIEGSIISRTIDDKLAIVNFLTLEDKMAERDGHNNNYLYIISDDEIKEGDYVFLEDDNPFEKEHLIIRVKDAEIGMGESDNSTIAFSLKDVKKVIATTDPNLTKVDEVSGDNVWTSPITQIPKSIIEYYAKHYPKEIELEYEQVYIGNGSTFIKHTGEYKYRLKLNNNEVVWVEPEFYSQKYGKFKGVFRYNEDESVDVVEINSLDKVKTQYTREEMLQELDNYNRWLVCSSGTLANYVRDNL